MKTSPAYLIDGYNYLHAVLLRGRVRSEFWAHDRQRELVAHLRTHALDSVQIVFDATSPERIAPDLRELGVVYAVSADDEIVRVVRTATRPDELCVVTADRALADRVRHHGGRWLRPWSFEAGERPL